MNRRALILALLCLAGASGAGAAQAAQSGVVLLYHRFGESKYPDTSVGLERFDAEIAELKTGGYAPMAIPDMVRALREGRDLPELAVGISADDAYLSIFTEAWPRLKAAGIPLTIFVATDPVDRGFADYMSWDQIRQLVKEGVTVGAHTASHLHMADASAQTNAGEIARSNARFKAELGFVPELFAYPYGQTSLAVTKQVEDAGYAFAFGQHSGAIGPASDFFYLPRFSVNEHFGGIAAFRLRARALALPVHDLEPADPQLAASPKTISFTVDAGVGPLDRMSCFGAGGEPIPPAIAGARVTLTPAQPIAPGFFRLGCTLPAGEGRFRWFGTAYYLPKK